MERRHRGHQVGADVIVNRGQIYRMGKMRKRLVQNVGHRRQKTLLGRHPRRHRGENIIGNPGGVGNYNYARGIKLEYFFINKPEQQGHKQGNDKMQIVKHRGHVVIPVNYSGGIKMLLQPQSRDVPEKNKFIKIIFN